MTQDDEDGSKWDPNIALQVAGSGEDTGAVLGIATLPIAEVLGLDATVRDFQQLLYFSVYTHKRTHAARVHTPTTLTYTRMV